MRKSVAVLGMDVRSPGGAAMDIRRQRAMFATDWGRILYFGRVAVSQSYPQWAEL